MHKVAIIILNWNRKSDTLDCIKSISKLRLNNISLNVIIVDNASTDGSVKAFKKLNSKKYDIKVIENKENLGFAAGNNIGLKYAMKSKFDYIMLLNNDTELDKELLVQFIKAAENNDKWGLLSPKIYFSKGFEFHKGKYKKSELGKVIWSAGGNIDWDNVFGINRGVDEVDTGQYDVEEEIDFATGACVFINPAAIAKVGVFDERYYMYFEDVDLSVRMKKMNYKINYVPKAKLWHKVAQSSGIGSGLNDYFIARNRILFGVLYAPLRTRLALMRESFRLLINGRKWQKKKEY